jgi:carbonic anhydrase/acetyltransferase-like protein (isoleucine patch superfamily)
VLLEGCLVGAGATIEGSILAADVEVGEQTTIEQGCVIGEGATIAAGASLQAGTRIQPGELVAAETVPT